MGRHRRGGSPGLGLDRLGVRLSPFGQYGGIHDSDPLGLFGFVIGELSRRRIAYLHLVEADWDDAPQFTEEFRQAIRARFTRPIIVAGKYDKVRADWVLAKGYADLVAFGRPFVANPDLPRRLAQGLPLAALDPNTLFGGGEVGYSDYPAWSEREFA